MYSKVKVVFLSLILISGIICLSSFRPQINASIVGTWTQTTIQQVTKRGNAAGDDTATYHPKGYEITFTPDMQYLYTAPYNKKANGIYTINGDLLNEESTESHTTEQFKILTLTEHVLVTHTIGKGLQSGVAIETTTSYSR